MKKYLLLSMITISFIGFSFGFTLPNFSSGSTNEGYGKISILQDQLNSRKINIDEAIKNNENKLWETYKSYKSTKKNLILDKLNTYDIVQSYLLDYRSNMIKKYLFLGQTYAFSNITQNNFIFYGEQENNPWLVFPGKNKMYMLDGYISGTGKKSSPILSILDDIYQPIGFIINGKYDSAIYNLGNYSGSISFVFVIPNYISNNYKLNFRSLDENTGLMLLPTNGLLVNGWDYHTLSTKLFLVNDQNVGWCSNAISGIYGDIKFLYSRCSEARKGGFYYGSSELLFDYYNKMNGNPYKYTIYDSYLGKMYKSRDGREIIWFKDGKVTSTTLYSY